MSDSQRLISAYFDNELTDQQFAELVAWISEDSANMAKFVRASCLDSCLYDLLQGEDIRELLRDAPGDTPEIELWVNTENILSMLEEDAKTAQQKAKERSEAQQYASEVERRRRMQASQWRHPQRRKPAVVPPWKALYAKAILIAAVVLFCFLPFAGINNEPAVVAKIVGSEGVVWGSDNAAMAAKTDLQRGQVLHLESGLMEMAFGDGTRVILEGPARFTVKSRNEGELQLGKLVARASSEAEGFRIRTPGMKIVDLGTEFAVSVNQQQVAYLHVFDGRVSATSFDTQGKTVRQRMVLANEAVYLRPKTGGIEPTSSVTSRYFTRKLPSATKSRTQRASLSRYSTGGGLAVGEIDPHWRIIAAQNDPDFVPQPAIVASGPGHTSNDPQQTQWVSFTADLENRPTDAQYTFRMTFSLLEADSLPNRIQGSFRADDLLVGIRVNGTSISVPKHAIGTYKKQATLFDFDRKHLKPGQNIIEFDVLNAGKIRKIDWDTAVALWVQWKGGG